MSRKTLNLALMFNASSLITRQAAREVFDLVSVLSEKTITLDFSHIEYASRSFFDELNVMRDRLLHLGKKIELSHLNANLQKLLQFVNRAPKSKSSSSYSRIPSAEVITIR